MQKMKFPSVYPLFYKAEMERIVAIDAGKEFTGVVVADVRVGSEDHTEIILMKLLKSHDYSHSTDTLLAFIDAEVAPLIANINSPVRYVYERLEYYSGKANKKKKVICNWPLKRLSKTIRDKLERMSAIGKSLYATQKHLVNLKSYPNRKECAVATATRLLEQECAEWLQKFDTLERQHDVADCICMIEYVKRKAKPLPRKKKNVVNNS